MASPITAATLRPRPRAPAAAGLLPKQLSASPRSKPIVILSPSPFSLSTVIHRHLPSSVCSFSVGQNAASLLSRLPSPAACIPYSFPLVIRSAAATDISKSRPPLLDRCHPAAAAISSLSILRRPVRSDLLQLRTCRCLSKCCRRRPGQPLLLQIETAAVLPPPHILSFSSDSPLLPHRLHTAASSEFHQRRCCCPLVVRLLIGVRFVAVQARVNSVSANLFLIARSLSLSLNLPSPTPSISCTFSVLLFRWRRCPLFRGGTALLFAPDAGAAAIHHLVAIVRYVSQPPAPVSPSFIAIVKILIPN